MQTFISLPNETFPLEILCQGIDRGALDVQRLAEVDNSRWPMVSQIRQDFTNTSGLHREWSGSGLGGVVLVLRMVRSCFGQNVLDPTSVLLYLSNEVLVSEPRKVI